MGSARTSGKNSGMLSMADYCGRGRERTGCQHTASRSMRQPVLNPQLKSKQGKLWGDLAGGRRI